MKNQAHIWIYTILVASFLSFKVFECSGYNQSFLSSYFEDFLAMPIFLKTGLLILQLVNDKWRNYQILKRDIIILTVITGIYFEWIIPKYDTRFTTDLLDFIAYSAGSVFYFFLLNKRLKLRLKVN